MSPEEIAEELYSSEINFTVSIFWDAGYTVRLGDDWNGYSEEWHADDLGGAFDQLKRMAIKLYPNSEFTKKHKG